MYEVEVFTRFAGLGKKLEPVDVIQVAGPDFVISLQLLVTLGRGQRIWPQGMHVAGWTRLCVNFACVSLRQRADSVR